MFENRSRKDVKLKKRRKNNIVSLCFLELFFAYLAKQTFQQRIDADWLSYSISAWPGRPFFITHTNRTYEHDTIGKPEYQSIWRGMVDSYHFSSAQLTNTTNLAIKPLSHSPILSIIYFHKIFHVFASNKGREKRKIEIK